MEAEERGDVRAVERPQRVRQKMVTPAQYSAACKVAAEVYRGRKRLAEGVEELASTQGLNAGTASDFINGYRHLCEGTVFRRTMSAEAMSHFLGRIAEEYGHIGLKKAVQALELHLEYFEGHYQRKALGMRAVLEAFARRVNGLQLASEVEEKFAAAVANSLRDSASERRKRLEAASKTVKAIKVQTWAFVRNPDVVAEVLIRANGICERCKAVAPFMRAKDGTPYLEVHHVLPLAKGGHDSVENAVALCPNCHREAHFGAGHWQEWLMAQGI